VVLPPTEKAGPFSMRRRRKGWLGNSSYTWTTGCRSLSAGDRRGRSGLLERVPMKRLDYLWRLFGTALSFASFGIGGLVLSLTVFPLMNLFVRNLDARAAYAQRLVHVMFRLHRNFMVAMGVLDFEAHNAEALAQDEGVLVVANHPTLLDVVLLMSLMRRSQCIVKAEIWRNPFMRGVVNATGYIRNDGDAETLVADCAQGARVKIAARGRQYRDPGRVAHPAGHHKMRAADAHEGPEMVPDSAAPHAFHHHGARIG